MVNAGPFVSSTIGIWFGRGRTDVLMVVGNTRCSPQHQSDARLDFAAVKVGQVVRFPRAGIRLWSSPTMSSALPCVEGEPVAGRRCPAPTGPICCRAPRAPGPYGSLGGDLARSAFQ